MKNYLNSAEKDHLSMLVKLAGKCDETLTEWKHNMTATERKWLKTAMTFLDKGLVEILERINTKDALLVRKRVYGTSLLMLPNEEFKRMVKKYDEEHKNDTLTVREGYFFDVAIAAFEHTCRNCQQTDPESCRFRTIYQEMEVPFYDENAPEGVCPYYAKENNDK